MALDTAPEKFESAQGQRTRNSASAPTNPLTPEKKTQHASGNEIIEYVYYPKKGKTQRVCVILGKDKRETIQFVKKGFSDLAEIEEDRFDFQVFNGRGNWVNVLEEAWEAIRRDMPPIWIVIIKESPEEREQRIRVQKRSNRRRITNLIALAAGVSVSSIASRAGVADGTFLGYLKGSAWLLGVQIMNKFLP